MFLPRQTLSKKYHRGVKIINNVDTALLVASMGLGVAGVGLLSTIIAAPVVLVLEAIALGTGLLGIVGVQATKKLTHKAEKHENIKVLAEAKLNTISGFISKALRDDRISDEEYDLVLLEHDKYRQMKEDLRRKIKNVINAEMKQSLISLGREEAIDSFQRMFNKNRTSFRKIFDNNEVNNSVVTNKADKNV